MDRTRESPELQTRQHRLARVHATWWYYLLEQIDPVHVALGPGGSPGLLHAPCGASVALSHASFLVD